MFKDFDEYQARAHLTAAVKQGGRAGKVWAASEFASEWMELGALIMSNATKAQFRPKGTPEKEFVSKLKRELGDAVWVISEVALNYGLLLSEVVIDNLSKVIKKHESLIDITQEKQSGVDNEVAVLGEPWRLPAKPSDPFPWIKGNKKAIKTCPRCGTDTKFSEGCVSCQAPGCGWSAC